MTALPAPPPKVPDWPDREYELEREGAWEKREQELERKELRVKRYLEKHGGMSNERF